MDETLGVLPALTYDFQVTMYVQHSADAQPVTPDARVLAAVEGVSQSFLRATIETIAVSRHYELPPENNRLTAHSIAGQLLQPIDTPDTLDYDFLRRVSQILIATILTSIQSQRPPAPLSGTQ